MPFDGSGNATIVNSFTPSTVISSSQVNANFTDIATMLTNTLPRDGQAAMTGQLKATDGTVSAPGMTFGSDLNNGAYRTGTDAWSLAVGGAQAVGFTTSGVTFAKPMVWTKGADVASASPLVLVFDGNYFDVTGTTGFSQITCPVGSLFILQFDGALTMTDGANLDLGGNNITTAAGDRALFFAHTANTAQLIAYRKEGQSPLLLDEDDMTSNSAAHAPTQQSTKAYVDTAIAAIPSSTLLTVGTADTTLSGTTGALFSDLPANIKRILITWSALSLDDTDNLLIQIGDSGGLHTTGYVSAAKRDGSGVTSTAGFIIAAGDASHTYTGMMTLVNITGNIWVSSHSGIDQSAAGNMSVGAGTVTLDSALTQIALLDTAGDNFDGGSINIMYEV